jgi:hypothetical protein
VRLSEETIHLLCLFGDSNAIEAWQTCDKVEFVFMVDNIPVEIQFYARNGNVTLEPRILTGED